MRPSSIDWIANAVQAISIVGITDSMIHHVCTDSREVEAGSLFVARKGAAVDGRQFISKAFAAGASACICDHEPGIENQKFDGPVIFVEDATIALGQLATEYRKTLSATVIAITGSVGKTTTKEMLGQAFESFINVVRARKSYNNEVGVPLTILSAKADTDLVIVEAGTNGPGEIDHLGRIIAPDIAIITAVGYSHLEGLHDIDSVAAEKSDLLKHVAPDGFAILNGDDIRVKAMADTLRHLSDRPKVITVGFGAHNDVHGFGMTPMSEAPDSGKRGSRSTMQLGGGQTVKLQIPGEHMQRNALFVIGVAEAINADLRKTIRGLSQFQAPEGRLNIKSAGEWIVFDDCYNANPSSVRAALECTTIFAQGRPKVAILGSMLELGKHSRQHHKDMGRLVARYGFDALITVGEEAHAIASEAQRVGFPRERVHCFVNAREAERSSLISRAEPGTIFLVKGSRRIGLEQIVKTLQFSRSQVIKRTKSVA